MSRFPRLEQTLRSVGLDSAARAVWRVPGRARAEWRRRTGYVDRDLIDRYFAGAPVPKLHLGCGYNRLGGWLNTDVAPSSPAVLRLDATGPFPFDDGTFDYAFNEHIIEHVPYPDGERMVQECFRVLRPGGILRTTTPDLAFLVQLYLDPDSEITQAYLRFYAEAATPWAPTRDPVFYLNNFVRDWGHQFIYDEGALRLALEAAGFTDIRRCACGESDHEALQGIENERRMPEGYVAMESFVMEATRPR